MHQTIKALSDFSEAQRVIEWLAENNLLVNTHETSGQLAYGYAIRYASTTTIETFAALVQVHPRRSVQQQTSIRDQAYALAADAPAP